MKKLEIVKKIGPFVDKALSGMRRVAVPLGNILLFSAADERISPGKDLCVAVEKSGISVAFGTRFFSSVSVKRVKEYPSADHTVPQPKEVAASVVLAAREIGAAGRGITLSIPREWVVMRSVEFPAAVGENISGAVAFEFDRLVPFGRDEAFYDFSVIGRTLEKITVVIAAAKANRVGGYIEALYEAGFNVDMVTLNLIGMGALCRTMSRQKDFILIGTDGSDYEGALFTDGAPSEVVGGRFAGDDDGDDERTGAETITIELKPLIDAAKKNGNSPNVFALLRGGKASFKERIRSGFGLPVVMLDEQKNIPYAAAGGVMEALRPEVQRMNLLSKGQREKTKIPVVLTALLVMFLIGLSGAYFMAPVQVEEKRLEAIDHKIRALKVEVRDSETLKKEIDALNSDIATINGFKESRPMALTILKELTILLPKSAWLTRVRFIESKVEIEGYASSASELLSRLESSKYFGHAEFASPTFRDARMNSDRFNIKMEIKGMKPAETKEEPQNKNQTRGHVDAGTRGRGGR